MTELEVQEMARRERNKYHREWRKRNKDKVKDANARYWIRKAAKLMAEREGTDVTLSHESSEEAVP